MELNGEFDISTKVETVLNVAKRDGIIYFKSVSKNLEKILIYLDSTRSATWSTL